MKLKKLTIDNIASIEHAEIDFDAAPLAGEHLFLITGETAPANRPSSTASAWRCMARRRAWATRRRTPSTMTVPGISSRPTT